MIYKVMKVFDCQDMPEKIKRSLFDIYSDYSIGNDCAIKWTVHHDDTEYDSDDERSIKRRLIDVWLIENGAEDRAFGKYNGETVIIKYWW